MRISDFKPTRIGPDRISLPDLLSVVIVVKWWWLSQVYPVCLRTAAVNLGYHLRFFMEAIVQIWLSTNRWVPFFFSSTMVGACTEGSRFFISFRHLTQLMVVVVDLLPRGGVISPSTCEDTATTMATPLFSYGVESHSNPRCCASLQSTVSGGTADLLQVAYLAPPSCLTGCGYSPVLGYQMGRRWMIVWAGRATGLWANYGPVDLISTLNKVGKGQSILRIWAFNDKCFWVTNGPVLKTKILTSWATFWVSLRTGTTTRALLWTWTSTLTLLRNWTIVESWIWASTGPRLKCRTYINGALSLSLWTFYLLFTSKVKHLTGQYNPVFSNFIWILTKQFNYCKDQTSNELFLDLSHLILSRLIEIYLNRRWVFTLRFSFSSIWEGSILATFKKAIDLDLSCLLSPSDSKKRIDHLLARSSHREPCGRRYDIHALLSKWLFLRVQSIFAFKFLCFYLSLNLVLRELVLVRNCCVC